MLGSDGPSRESSLRASRGDVPSRDAGTAPRDRAAVAEHGPTGADRLFGSRARGDASSNSDLDLLVVEESSLPRYRRAPRYLRALVGIFPAKDVIVWTPGEIDSWRNVPNAFINVALREGRVLYERG